MEDIEITIKTIRISLLKFNYDMKNNTPGGLSSFLNDYPNLLRAFAGYKEAEEHLSFKDEQTAIYNYLFKGGNINAIAKNNLSEGDTGAIIAFKQNTNPLDIIPDYRGISKSSSIDPFADFVKKYSHLYSGDKTEILTEYNTTPIIPIEYIHKIYKEFDGYFKDESKELWGKRFNYPNGAPVTDMKIDEEANDDNDKLIVVAILAAIHGIEGVYSVKGKYDFPNFVSERFGIKGFKQARDKAQYKQKYKEVQKGVKDILRKPI